VRRKKIKENDTRTSVSQGGILFIEDGGKK